MNGGEVFSIILSIFVSFLFGAIAMLFFGGKTALNYLMVKVSRGKKVLILLRTKYGWRSIVGKKEEDNVVWKFDGKHTMTTIKDDNGVHRYFKVDMIFIDSKTPTVAIKLNEGALYPDDFDHVVFNNILIRALTRPNVEGQDTLKKLIIIVIILLIVVVFGVLLTYLKLGEVMNLVTGTMVI
jgi:hypothetical protein